MVGNLTDTQRHVIEVVDTALKGPDGVRDPETLRDILEMMGLIKPAAKPRDLCGTWQGRNRHTQMNETICHACMEANRVYMEGRRKKRETSS